MSVYSADALNTLVDPVARAPCFPRLDGAGFGAKRTLSGLEAWRELHVQLLHPSGAQHNALVTGMVARRKVDRVSDVRIDLESRS